MAEGTYEYECNRAELLGLDPPDREVFEAAARARQEEEQQNQALSELDLQDEKINQTSGKFDELNNILSVTQQRINKFKIACGSLTNLLKIRPNQETGLSKEQSENASSTVADNSIDSAIGGNLNNALDNLDEMKSMNERSDVSVLKQSSKDMQQKMSSQFDRLDDLITKAENAQYSMAKQTKDMKNIMK